MSNQKWELMPVSVLGLSLGTEKFLKDHYVEYLGILCGAVHDHWADRVEPSEAQMAEINAAWWEFWLKDMIPEPVSG